MPYTKRLCTCDVCGLKFISDWSEEEALADLAKRFPGTPVEECGVLCNECYELFMEWWKNRNL